MKKKLSKRAKKAESSKPPKNKRIKSASKKAPDKKPKRNARGQLMKGHTANPHGRPKISYKYGEYYQELLESKDISMEISVTSGGAAKKKKFKFSTDKNFRMVLFARLLSEGLNGNISAIRELLDRSEGKPTQPLAGALGINTGKSYEELLNTVQTRHEKLVPFRTGTG